MQGVILNGTSDGLLRRSGVSVGLFEKNLIIEQKEVLDSSLLRGVRMTNNNVFA